MKLFTKEIDNKLFEQYQKGSDLENQKVVAKIFNPYGRGTWYLLNSDPQDPDYIWAIVDLFEVEMGSISRSELESIKVPPFGLGLERDLSFTPINAKELYMGLLNGKQYAEGGSVQNIEKFLSKNLINHIGLLDKEQLTKMKKELSDEISRSEKYDKDFKGSNREFSLNKELDLINYRLEEKYEVGGQTSLFEEGGSVSQQNKEMLKNQAKEFMHHSQELNSLVDKTKQVDAWVVAKAERASTDLSDITHYLDGRIMAKGGNLISIKEIEKEYKENEEDNLHSENVVLLAENFGTEEELSEAKSILKQHEEEGSLSTELYNRRSVLEDILWKKYQTMKKVVMAKGGMVVTSIKDIPNFKQRLNEGKITYRGLGLGKKFNDFYDLAGENGVIIKVDGKEYNITMTEFDSFSRGKDGKIKIRFDAPYRKHHEQGGMMAKGGKTYNQLLQDFNVDDLDDFETMRFERMVDVGLPKEEAIQMLINEVEGDYSQLSPKLARVAKKQDKMGMADGGMMAKGGKILGEIGTTYYIGTPEVDKTGRFGRKRATWKTCVVDENGNKRYGQFTISIIGNAKNNLLQHLSYHKLHGVVITQKEFDNLTFSKMDKGGMTTFKDKVQAISKRLEGTKVPTRLKKDYGATYDKKEAKQAGQRIAGSMIQKIKQKMKNK